MQLAIYTVSWYDEELEQEQSFMTTDGTLAARQARHGADVSVEYEQV